MIHKRGDVMPKIIKDVEKTIRSCALELFIELSYTNVDMKMISKKSGVAVGTLYNYYENKKQLYISILKESWENTFNKLDAISELTISPGEKLRKFVSALYEDIEARNGLGKALINTSVADLKDDKEINGLKNSLILRVENFLNCLDKVETLSKCSNVDTRLAESLLVSTLVMLEFHPNDKEDNINFLVDFIGLSVK
jgi:AcrR family transcriptional regulator